jgi:hypothetical protein
MLLIFKAGNCRLAGDVIIITAIDLKATQRYADAGEDHGAQIRPSKPYDGHIGSRFWITLVFKRVV